ncbi:chromodomain-helicase-DNA-binding protein 7-like, partial [Oppia nitens]|uniref:chromodomain-helicase-DNA-binding protein 7-like n=1 Tax=Oppia nitens TaxID=1686743 RepID=UPI0023DBDC18
MFYKEMEKVTKITAQYLVNVYGFWAFDNCIYISMEYCLMNLKEAIKLKAQVFGRQSSDEPMDCMEYYITCEILLEVLECVRYLHELQPPVIHRDLKPDNILIANRIRNGRFIKLCDYSISCIIEELFDTDVNDSRDKYIKHEWSNKYCKLLDIIKHTMQPIYDERPTCGQIIEQYNEWAIDSKVLTNNFNNFNEKLQQIKQNERKVRSEDMDSEPDFWEIFYTFVCAKKKKLKRTVPVEIEEPVDVEVKDTPTEEAIDSQTAVTTNMDDATQESSQSDSSAIESSASKRKKKKSSSKSNSKPRIKNKSPKRKLPKLALKFSKNKKRRRFGSGSDHSDLEKTPPPSPDDTESGLQKRRSARNTKRRKYTDDIDLDLSDDDNPLQTKDSVDNTSKPLTDGNVSSISEDTMVVEKIMSSRMGTRELEDDLDQQKIEHFYRFRKHPPKSEWKPKKRPKPADWKKIGESPVYKGVTTLREYQLEGLNWISFCWHNNQNCILADEMGLGKTIQSLAFVNEMTNHGINGPFLVIAPLSTIGNWQREFETWTDLNVITYHGSSASRNVLQEYEMYYKNDKYKKISGIYKFQVMITTFEIVLTDCLELREIHWKSCIIDEAQRLKNRNCKLLEGLRLLDVEHRVLLTGTPLQNNVEELFSLLNFLEPTQFTSNESFMLEFGDLKTEAQVDKLKAILKPMMLRRLKEDVEKTLAPKEETIVEVELTNIQKKYYRAILERNFQFLSKGGSYTNMPNLMNTMMELRKCHPFLLNGAEEHIFYEYREQHGKEGGDTTLFFSRHIFK